MRDHAGHKINRHAVVRQIGVDRRRGAIADNLGATGVVDHVTRTRVRVHFKDAGHYTVPPELLAVCDEVTGDPLTGTPAVH